MKIFASIARCNFAWIPAENVLDIVNCIPQDTEGATLLLFFFLIHSGKNWSYLPETNQVWLPGPAAFMHLLFLRKKQKKKKIRYYSREVCHYSRIFPARFPDLCKKKKRKKKKLCQERHRAVRLSLDVRACHTSVFSKVFYIFLKVLSKRQWVGVSCKIKHPGTVFFLCALCAAHESRHWL